MVVLRLKRLGRTHRPFYRLNAMDQRSPRDGKFIEQIGTYDPKVKGENFKLDLSKADEWIKKGAQPSETVASFIKKTRKAAAAAA